MHNGKFFTLTTATETGDQLLLTRIGANDPKFNLRRDPAIILRRPHASDTIFASVIEPHGSYNPVSESARNSNSNIAMLTILKDDDEYTAVSIETISGKTRVFIVSNNNVDSKTSHNVEIGGKGYRWSGPFHYSSM